MAREPDDSINAACHRVGITTASPEAVAKQLETLVWSDQAYAAARRRALARLRQGYDMGGEPPLSRSEAHNREGLR